MLFLCKFSIIGAGAENLIQTKELNEISVSDICKRAGLNRTTFYANYSDIYGLADTIRERLEIIGRICMKTKLHRDLTAMTI